MRSRPAAESPAAFTTSREGVLIGPFHGRAIRRDAHPPGHGQGFWQAGRLGGAGAGAAQPGPAALGSTLIFFVPSEVGLHAVSIRPPHGLHAPVVR